MADQDDVLQLIEDDDVPRPVATGRKWKIAVIDDDPAVHEGTRFALGDYSLNGQIHVDGDTAWAQWYLFMPCTVADGNEARWRAGIDHERYVRVNGVWMFSHKRSEPLMNATFKAGWAA